MSYQTNLHTLALASIAHRCARETDLFFQRQRYDPRYCYELFRRAIADRSQRAWEMVYTQYRSLVTGWVNRHPAFAESGEEVQYFVNRAFERMWRAVTAEKFSRFRDLKSVLRYLQMCVHSVVLDRVRSAGHAMVARQVEDSTAGNVARDPVYEEPALANVCRQEFWAQINARLRNEQERQVVYGSFVLALKPREVVARYPETFGDVKHVYRIKENVLARLGRDAELERILGPDA
jgi:DNA-directed RNA polymerase specialized sigma24 family protein